MVTQLVKLYSWPVTDNIVIYSAMQINVVVVAALKCSK